MLLSGFTFIRNALKYDFPIVECIQSMLPLVDELVVNVGRSEDQTEKLLQNLAAENPKIRLIYSVWDDKKTESGLVLSEQTNLALDACQGRWALYLQADEAVSEADYSLIRRAIEEEDKKASPADGFRFRYLHFYGGYTLVQRPWNWYPSEIRVVRKNSGAKSFGDAQTFRLGDESKLNTVLLPAHVYHYGHAREPEKMATKIKYFHRFWHGDDHKIRVQNAYQVNFKNLVWFWGKHPSAYGSRVNQGVQWSPKPEMLFPEKIKKVYMIGSLQDQNFSNALSRSLEKEDVMVVQDLSFFGVMKAIAFEKEPHALVDFDSEKRNVFSLLFLRLLKKTWKIAFAPVGKLHSFSAKSFSAVMWGGHEKREEGFELPQQFYVQQILSWLGISSYLPKE